MASCPRTELHETAITNLTIPPKTRVLSPPERHLIATCTGCFAGACTAPVAALLTRSSSISFRIPALRSGARFSIFDVTRNNLPSSFPVPLAIGMSGASGGAGEVILHSLVAQRALPSFHAVASHSGRLFLGFGTFASLTKFFSEEFPPKPLLFCWLLGAVAGGVAAGMGEVVESRGKVGMRQLGRTTGIGAAVVGTVISVQLTSSAEVIKWMEGRCI